ncbi:YunC family protein [Methanoplanus limicola]|uniref:DUF1805 domain-containing protein n=1 Tax=Methanoplanus limicola DSM 2279 TaxID=937775 RepID=H1YZA7_9EURY|nr:YunC family protein [Methanoplanus limicola]EHQ35131.1 protein of unknown function DUF1805 [Methanoplanus limicola DSM 2279]
MSESKIEISGKEIECFEIPLGDVNLVFAKTDDGLIGCGAFDVIALEKFSYAAAKVRPSGNSVKDVEDLLNGEIALANRFAKDKGITEGMSGREAIEKLI